MASKQWARFTISKSGEKLVCHVQVFNGGAIMDAQFDVPLSQDEFRRMFDETLKRLGYNPVKA